MTRRSDVAGLDKFPEIDRWFSQCRLCQLVRTNPQVLSIIHMLYKQGVAGRPLVARVEPVFAEAGEEMPTRQSFNRHFEAHCVMPKPARAPTQRPSCPSDAAVPEADPLATTDYETDYAELRELYGQFKLIFQKVRSEYTEAAVAKSPITDYGLVMLVKLAGELRQTLKTLSDMRNNEKFVAVLLARHTENVVHFIGEPLGVALRHVRDQLEHDGDPALARAELDRLLNGGLTPTFTNASARALERSKSAYKLN